MHKSRTVRCLTNSRTCAFITTKSLKPGRKNTKRRSRFFYFSSNSQKFKPDKHLNEDLKHCIQTGLPATSEKALSGETRSCMQNILRLLHRSCGGRCVRKFRAEKNVLNCRADGVDPGLGAVEILMQTVFKNFFQRCILKFGEQSPKALFCFIGKGPARTAGDIA